MALQQLISNCFSVLERTIQYLRQRAIEIIIYRTVTDSGTCNNKLYKYYYNMMFSTLNNKE